MRTLMKVSFDAESGNHALSDGTLGRAFGSVAEMIKPEASYFLTENGMRTAYFFFELEATSQIVQIAEPLFGALNAEVHFTPVMNQEELENGLQAWKASQ